MVIIQIDGGLGNQMFQYALCLSFKNKGIKTKMDISKFEKGYLHNGYELEKIFALNEKYCSKTERVCVKSMSKIMHVLFKHPYKEKPDWQWSYNEDVTKIQFGFLKGYWQSYKYFSNISKIVRAHFTFPSPKDNRNKEVLRRMENTNSVSLHIRRGDYLINDNPSTINPDYYLNSISMINEKVSNPNYFIFSDDIKWAKENIKVSPVEFIDWNSGTDSFIDMQLMSCCKHNIIANSSFSWWGAWLNNNPSRIVIAPQKWMPHIDGSGDIIPDDWVQLPTTF